MIEIDGSHGEGGGQILRTALALSAATGEPCKVTSIRKNRPQPGLKAQHLEAARALSSLCDAEVSGMELRSTEILFRPGKINGGKLHVNIPTAGSIALVLQGIMIASVSSKKDISVEITGGATSGKWAPSINYLKNVLLPLLGKSGFEGYVDVERYGYYPEGGASVKCNFVPRSMKHIDITERGKIISIEGLSHASKSLEKSHVAERQKKSFTGALKADVMPVIFDSYFAAAGSGSGIDVWIKTENSFLGAGALEEKGKDAESVGKEAAAGVRKLLESGAPLDEHAEDQLLPFMALAGSGILSCYHMTQHARTNISVIEKFLPVKFSLKNKILTCES